MEPPELAAPSRAHASAASAAAGLGAAPAALTKLALGDEFTIELRWLRSGITDTMEPPTPRALDIGPCCCSAGARRLGEWAMPAFEGDLSGGRSGAGVLALSVSKRFVHDGEIGRRTCTAFGFLLLWTLDGGPAAELFDALAPPGADATGLAAWTPCWNWAGLTDSPEPRGGGDLQWRLREPRCGVGAGLEDVGIGVKPRGLWVLGGPVLRDRCGVGVQLRWAAAWFAGAWPCALTCCNVATGVGLPGAAGAADLLQAGPGDPLRSTGPGDPLRSTGPRKTGGVGTPGVTGRLQPPIEPRIPGGQHGAIGEAVPGADTAPGIPSRRSKLPLLTAEAVFIASHAGAVADGPNCSRGGACNPVGPLPSGTASAFSDASGSSQPRRRRSSFRESSIGYCLPTCLLLPTKSPLSSSPLLSSLSAALFGKR